MNKKMISRFITYGVSVGILVSCAIARVVSVEPGEGGVIAIAPQGSEEARGKAMILMQSNCGSKRAKVIKEGEEVVGQETRGEATAGKGWGGHTQVNSHSTTRNATEWRLTYKCI